MEIAERQKEILNSIVEEYIASAQPVSSQLLERGYNFGICPATIRIEMQKLTDKGFLFQPHTSAGRVPTDKGYRFFVDELLKEKFLDSEKDFEIEDWFEKEIEDSLKFVQKITKNLALASSSLTLSYLLSRDFLWKEGWEKIFREPEFKDFNYSSHFVEMVNNFEKEIESFFSENLLKPKIYIGKENPLPRAKDFSIIISKCHFPQSQEGILALLGPKRMSYQRNIGLINSLMKLLEKY